MPADRVAELSAEVEPVLALLNDSLDEARRIRTDAGDLAERSRRRADERAAAILAQARRDAEAERSEAATRVSERAETESADIIARAEAEAAAVRRRGDERMPEYVEHVLAAVRAGVAGFVASTTGAGRSGDSVT